MTSGSAHWTLEDIVGELPRRPLMAGREGLRLSLAGAQSKLPVLIRNAAIARNESVLSAANDPAMVERVAGIIQERAASLLQSMSKA